MTVKRAKLLDALKQKGKSRKDLLKDLIEEEIHRRAKSDPENLSLTDEQLAEFVLAKKRKKMTRKVKVKLSDAKKRD